jgi:hypothetical protein
MDFGELKTQDIRLVMLRLLEEDQNFSLNDSLIQGGLELLGHGVSRDKVKTEISWLKEQGLVEIKSVGSVTVATLTERGQSVALGRASVPGVKRPGPRN